MDFSVVSQIRTDREWDFGLRIRVLTLYRDWLELRMYKQTVNGGKGTRPDVGWDLEREGGRVTCTVMFIVSVRSLARFVA